MKGLIIILLLFVIPLVTAEHCAEVPLAFLAKVSMHSEEIIVKEVPITAKISGKVDISTNVPYLSLETEHLTLSANETKNVEITFNTSGVEPGVYVGVIDIRGANSYHIPVILEVESKQLNYDFNLEIAPLYTSVEAGNTFVFDATLFNLIESEQVSSVETTFYLYDHEGNLLNQESELIEVSERTRVTKSIFLPQNLDCVDYVVAAVVRSGDSVGVDSQTFRVSLYKSSLRRLIDQLKTPIDVIVFVIITILLALVVALLIIVKYLLSTVKK